MKKIVLMFFACLFFIFIGCENPANSSSQNNNQNNSSEESGNEEAGENEQEESDLDEEVEDTSLFKKGDIYAVITKDSDEITKKEYLSFTTNTSGLYYKETTESSIFEYDEDLNILIVGMKPYYIISYNNKLYWSDGYGVPKNGNSLIGEWNIGIATVTFKLNGTVTGSTSQGYTISGTYTYNDGIVTYIDDNDEDDNTIFYYSPEGRLYADFQQLQKVYSVGEIPSDPEPIAPKKDSAGVEYASLVKFNPTSGIYGYYLYDSFHGYKTIDKLIYLNFESSEFSYKSYGSLSSTTNRFTKESINDGTVVKIQTSSETFYMLKLSNGAIYLLSSTAFENVEKTDSSLGFYGNYDFEYGGYNFSASFNKDGTISGSDSYGDVSGAFSLQNGVLRIVLNVIDSYGNYVSLATTGLYYYDGEKPVFIIASQKLMQADTVGGEFYPTEDEALDLINYADASYKLAEVTSYEIGDLVCEDGSVIRISGGKYTIPSGKNPIAVIYKVTDNGKTGIGLGLYEASRAWATSETTGYSTFFPTRLNDGSANWDIICSTDPRGTAAGANYPMFYWAEQYGLNNYPTSVYSDSWYIPSLGDFIQIYNNKDYIENILIALNGSALDGTYWTSCQYTHEDSNAYGITYKYSDTYYSGRSDYTSKSSSCKVRVVHKFIIE